MAAEGTESVSGMGTPSDPETAPYAQQGYQAMPPMVMMPGPIRRRPRGYNDPNPCFCISLRTGCYVLGAFMIIINVISLILASLSVKGDVSTRKSMADDDKDNAQVSLVASVISLILGVVIFLAAGMLIRCLALTFGIWFALAVVVWLVVGSRAFKSKKFLLGVGYFLLACRDIYAASVGFSLAVQIKNGEYYIPVYPPPGEAILPQSAAVLPPPPAPETITPPPSRAADSSTS